MAWIFHQVAQVLRHVMPVVGYASAVIVGILLNVLTVALVVALLFMQ